MVLTKVWSEGCGIWCGVEYGLGCEAVVVVVVVVMVMLLLI